MSAAQMLPMTASTSVSTLLAPTGVSVALGTDLIQIEGPVEVIINMLIHWPAADGFPSDLDVNECTDGTHVCDQVCHNNVGSFTCSCNAGSTLSSDGHSCMGGYCHHHKCGEPGLFFFADIDECASRETHVCQQVCNNTIASYSCGCYPGYTLNPDQSTCSGMKKAVLYSAPTEYYHDVKLSLSI